MDPGTIDHAGLVREALGALEHMGFRPSHARALVDKALQVVSPGDVGALVHAALRAS